jgi:malate synthase
MTTPHSGVEVLAPLPEHYAAILNSEALAFVVKLQRAFNGRRKELLA